MVRSVRFAPASLAALAVMLCVLAPISAETAPATQPATPAVGDAAPDFTLKTLQDESVRLHALTKRSPVALVVLRGYPGYQCPICTRQVGDLIASADEFKKAGARVVMVYPGPAEDLREHAREFVHGQTLPDHFELVIDPDYAFTNAYGLRWDEPGETAYPSSFVLGRDNKVLFAKVSKTHGDRASAEQLIEALPKK